MGNILGHCKRVKWNERQILQSWVPMLSGMFIYDHAGNITGLNDPYFAQDYHAANDQLRTLPLLLKGRSGINRKMLKKIASLSNTSNHGGNVARNPSTLSTDQSVSIPSNQIPSNGTPDPDTSFTTTGNVQSVD